MPPIRHGPVIEIDSSPEPYPDVRTTRSTSRARSVGLKANAASEAKKRAKRPKALMGPVIELTDSEPDVVDDVPKQATRRKETSPVAGPSNVAGSSNGAKPKTTPSINDRLFFPSDDDEENVPVEDLDREIQNILVEEPPLPAPMQEDDPPPPTPPPPPPPEEPIDPISHTLAQILEIIPDIDPEHALGLVQEHLPAFGDLNDNSDAATWKERTTRAAEHVIGLVFEAGSYPKAEKNKKGKARAVEVPERENKRPKIDYKSVERVFMGGKDYFELALIHLQISFPHIPKAHIRRVLLDHNSFYAPTHLSIAAKEKLVKTEMTLLGIRATAPELVQRLGYSAKSTKYNPAKDRRRKLADEVFEEERVWLQAHLKDVFGVDLEGVVGEGGLGKDDKGKGKAVAVPEEDEVEDGTGIECQCCFAEYPFDKMVQCPEAHLFCSTCISTYASTKLSSNDASLTCMHPSSCSLPFPPSELRRILTPTLMSLYERVVQQKEVAQAGLEGLEECPWCEWKCVMEAGREQDRLFRCGNEEGGCGVVSCRFCWKKDHLPRSCKEVEEDKKLDGRHSIEEAMTAAMMRNCPKCKKAFIKDEGCNKMTCPNCRTLSCYVCRQVVTGYEHFDQRPGQPSTSKAGSKKCLLWDKVEERHAAEVKAAAEKALAEYKELHPDVAEEDLKVDLPVVPPPAPPPVTAPAFPAVNALHVGMMRHLPNAVGFGGGGGAGWGLPAVAGAGWGAGGGWGAPAGFGAGQPNAFGMFYNPYVHAPVPAPQPALALPPPPVRNVQPAPRRRNGNAQVAREPRPRRGQAVVNPNPNAVAGPANQRGGIVAPAVAPHRPATRAARGAVANPAPAANALVNAFAAPPPRAVRAFGANPDDPFALPLGPPLPPAAAAPRLAPPPPAAAAPAPRARKTARAAHRQAHMEDARVAIERQRARNEARAARGRQEAAQLRTRLERVREAMEMGGGGNGAGGGAGAGGAGGRRRAGAR